MNTPNKSLLPCPFCGCAADDGQGFHELIVIGCSSGETAQTRPFSDYNEAVRVWNRRDGCKTKRTEDASAALNCHTDSGCNRIKPV